MSLNETNAITQIKQSDAGDNDMVLALLDSGYRWRDANLTYSYQGWPRFNFDHEQSQMASALQCWSAVANLHFVRSSKADADILFEASTKAKNDGFAGKTGFPYQVSNLTGDHDNSELGRSHVALATDSAQVKQADAGQPGFELYLHEIGHSLGIKHPFDGGSTEWQHYFPGLKEGDKYLIGDSRLNQRLYSVMSYNSNSTSKAPDLDYTGYARGPMAFDIAAIQTLYGARTQYNTSDSFYRLIDDTTSDQSLLGWRCIWDTRGTDTIGYEGTANAVIDLRPATLQNEVGGGGRMSYTWRPGANGEKVMMGQGYTIAGDYTDALRDVDGVAGVLIEKARGGSGTDSITGNDAANELSGNGGVDTLVGGGGDDTLIGGAGIDVLKGGTGNDIYVVGNPFDRISETNFRHQDSGGIDTIKTTISHYALVENSRSQFENLSYAGTLSFSGTGNSLNNSITGGMNADMLTGGLGDDTLDGLGGADTMIGGAGDDTYIVDSTGDVVSENSDGDAGGIDTIRTSLKFYSLEDDPSSQIENLTLTSRSGAGGVGNALDNTITGNGGDDFLQGNSGNDTLIGAGGRDSLIGGSGDDTYVITDSSAVIVEEGGDIGGIDLVQTRFSSYALTDNVENLTFTDLTHRPRAHVGTGNALDNAMRAGSQADKLFGNDGDDYLYGYGGKDTLEGDAGSDTLRGGTGDDLLNGGTGIDTADYRDMTSKTDINLNLGIAKVLKSTGNETDTLVSIENVIGSQSSDNVTGDDNDNAFIYQGWYNRFSSSGGTDTFDGAGGSDTIDFAGFSVQMMTIDLGAGTAIGQYSVDSGTGTKNGSKTVVSFSHVENVVSSRGDDTIIGDGNDNTFVDAGAYRYQHESGGFDTYAGGEGSDTVDFSRYDSRIYLDLENGEVDASYHVSLEGGGQADGVALVARVSDIENIVAGLDSDTLKGDVSDNAFYYVGTFTADAVAGGSDTYDGRGGSNTIDMSKFHGKTDIDLAGGIVSSSYHYDNGEGGGTASTQLAILTNIQNAVGSAQADTIEGSGEDNKISGGGSGDRIVGNAGSDRLTGGAGIDTFVFDSTNSGNDVITDFTTLTSRRGQHDVLEFSTSVFIDWDHVLAATSDTEDGAYISFDDNNNGITLTGVTRQSLANHHEIDVVFV